MNSEKQTHKRIYKLLPVLLILFTFYIAVMPKVAFVSAADAPVGKAQDDDFDKRFREGRDLIDREDWAKAAEKFAELIDRYPNNKSTDAALYWLAFCYKKQKQFQKAGDALDRLIEKFPSSSWASDARVMIMEVAAPLGRVYGAVGATSPSGFSPVGVVKSTAVTPASGYVGYGISGEAYSALTAAAARTPLDRESEIKIAAFQSLLAADPKRAIETMGEILKPDSKASETLKLEMLRVVRRPRLLNTFSSASGAGVVNQSFSYQTGVLDKQFAALLREALVKSFQNETNPKVRREIISVLANSADDQSTDYLKKLYASEQDREMKKAIINSFGSSLGNSFFYAFGTDTAQKRKTETDVLMEIVRTERDLELRRLAFSNLQRSHGWSPDEQTTQMFAQLYDAETDEQFKILIVRALANSKQNQATRKLMDIARSDRSDKLKLEAIYALRNSRDPEVIKFLEDLIR